MYKDTSHFCSFVLIFVAIYAFVSPVSARTARRGNKPVLTTSSRLNQEQKAAAFAALKSLHKLQAATEVGVSYTDYGSRLIDVKADVGEDLSNLPEGLLKRNLNLAMDAYVDARIAWGEITENGYWNILKRGETGKILAKYRLDRGANPAWDWKMKVDDDKDEQEAMAIHFIPAAIWSVANHALSQAKALIK